MSTDAQGDDLWKYGRKFYYEYGAAFENDNQMRKLLIEGTQVEEPKSQPIMITDSQGNKFWHSDGKFYREDGPAIEFANGNKVWFKDGKMIEEPKIMTGETQHYTRDNPPKIGENLTLGEDYDVYKKGQAILVQKVHIFNKGNILYPYHGTVVFNGLEFFFDRFAAPGPIAEAELTHYTRDRPPKTGDVLTFKDRALRRGGTFVYNKGDKLIVKRTQKNRDGEILVYNEVSNDFLLRRFEEFKEFGETPKMPPTPEVKASVVDFTLKKEEDSPVTEPTTAKPTHKYKVGDWVMSTQDWKGGFTSDPKKLGRGGNGTMTKGEVFQILSMHNCLLPCHPEKSQSSVGELRYRYSIGKNNGDTNYIPESMVTLATAPTAEVASEPNKTSIKHLATHVATVITTGVSLSALTIPNLTGVTAMTNLLADPIVYRCLATLAIAGTSSIVWRLFLSNFGTATGKTIAAATDRWRRLAADKSKKEDGKFVKLVEAVAAEMKKYS